MNDRNITHPTADRLIFIGNKLIGSLREGKKGDIGTKAWI